MRDLVEAGGVDLVLAQDRDRIARDPVITRWLQLQFKEHGCKLCALNDPEHESPESELTANILDSIAKFERAMTVQRTPRGMMQRVREGKVVGTGSPPYGFKYNSDRTNYEVDENTMPIVRRMFRMVADGHNIHPVKITLESEHIPPPRMNGKGERWYPTTIRRIILSDAYKGIWVYDRKGESIAVPIPDPGIPLEIIEEARERIKNNHKARSNAKHYYELRGIAYCGSCGLRVTPYSVKGKYRYYRCQKATKFGRNACDGRQRAADKLELEVADYVTDLIANSDKLSVQIDAAIAQESSRNPGEDVTSWLRIVEECNRKRSKYQEMFAADAMTLAELQAKLSELDEQKATAEEYLANARAGQSRVEELKATKRAIFKAYASGIQYDSIRCFSPEMRHEIYQALRLKITVGNDWIQR